MVKIGPAQVLSLFASGYYGDAPWTMFFTGVEGKPDTYRLMEKVPTIHILILRQPSDKKKLLFRHSTVTDFARFRG